MARKIIMDVAPVTTQAQEDTAPRRIQTLGELHHDEFSRAAIACAYAARDLLSMIERTAQDFVAAGWNRTYDRKWVAPSEELARDASSMLHSAVALMDLVPEGWSERAKEAVRLLKRSANASAVSESTLRIIGSYDETKDRDAIAHYTGILARATRAARKESHRALSELLEVFPDHDLKTC